MPKSLHAYCLQNLKVQGAHMRTLKQLLAVCLQIEQMIVEESRVY